jgi:hypothetical protein
MEFDSFYVLDVKNKAFGMWRHVETCRHFGKNVLLSFTWQNLLLLTTTFKTEEAKKRQTQTRIIKDTRSLFSYIMILCLLLKIHNTKCGVGYVMTVTALLTSEFHHDCT